MTDIHSQKVVRCQGETASRSPVGPACRRTEPLDLVNPTGLVGRAVAPWG